MKIRSEYKENIIGKMDKQINKGYDKYGTTLEHNVGLNMEQRLVHLQEELIDGLFYTEHLISKYRGDRKHIEELIAIVSSMMIELPLIQDENTREIFLDIAKRLNAVVKEMI